MAKLTTFQFYRGDEGDITSLANGEIYVCMDSPYRVYGGTPDGNKVLRGSSPLTTKGDIWVYSSADTRLPVGTDGYVLSADSTESTGLKWVAGGGGGSGLTHPQVMGRCSFWR